MLPGGWAVTGRAALLLLWWMYGGYAWLTNAAPPVTPQRRILLILGMVGLFVTALAIPHAYGSDRLVFACGYLVVVVVHAGMYVSEAARITRGMVVQLLGWNMLGAVLGLVGAVFFEDLLAWWWLAAFVVCVVLPWLVRITSMNRDEDDGGPTFELVPGHFVERHGLRDVRTCQSSALANPRQQRLPNDGEQGSRAASLAGQEPPLVDRTERLAQVATRDLDEPDIATQHCEDLEEVPPPNPDPGAPRHSTFGAARVHDRLGEDRDSVSLSCSCPGQTRQSSRDAIRVGEAEGVPVVPQHTDMAGKPGVGVLPTDGQLINVQQRRDGETASSLATPAMNAAVTCARVRCVGSPHEQ